MSSDSKNTASVEELYLKEKKKANILLASTIILAVLFVGSLAMGSGSNSTETAVNEASAVGQARQGGPGGRGGQAITEFFDDSGSVDQATVDAFLERFSQGGGPAGADPSQLLERFTLQIDTAVQNGEITEAQATELKAAFSQTESSEI